MIARVRGRVKSAILERNTLVYVFLVNSNSSIADFKSIYRYNDNINIIIVIIYDCWENVAGIGEKRTTWSMWMRYAASYARKKTNAARTHSRIRETNTRNSQPYEKYARKVPTYLQMRNHKDMHHVYATLETILPDLSLFNYFGCILKCN